MSEYIAYHEHLYTGSFEINKNPDAKITVLNTVNHPDPGLAFGTRLTEAARTDPPQADVWVGPVSNKAVVFSNCAGWTWNSPGCNSAHGVFGELDRELIHFLWDGMIFFGGRIGYCHNHIDLSDTQASRMHALLTRQNGT